MLVKLRRNWFAPNGIRYRTRDGLAEIPEDMEKLLPSDAVILSKKDTLPLKGELKQPGFGLKPEHEQVLDLIPYAGPSHIATPGAGAGVENVDLHPAKTPPSEKELEAAEKERERSEADAERTRKAEVKEEAKAVSAGVKEAEKVAKDLKKL